MVVDNPYHAWATLCFHLEPKKKTWKLTVYVTQHAISILCYEVHLIKIKMLLEGSPQLNKIAHISGKLFPSFNHAC